MAKKIQLPHWGSKGAINRAGDALRGDSVVPDTALVLESWRMAHRDVIHTFEAMLRHRAKKNQDVKIAQRLKRRITIIDKLSRYPSMQLARMDDVAGVRLIFPTEDALHEFRNKVHRARFRHVLKNEKEKYDYIIAPTERGYRGIHDIYEYRARRGRPKTCEGLLIEIQYRTSVQHAWATAVEVVTQMTENEPKFNRGDPRVIRAFCLVGELLARAHENRTTRFLELDNHALNAEFIKTASETEMMAKLIGLSLNDWVGQQMKADHVILHIAAKDRKFTLHQYDLELEAQTKLLELEKEFPDDDIVLVGAKTVGEVRSAFRNYFSDVKDFLALLYAAHAKFDPEFVKSDTWSIENEAKK